MLYMTHNIGALADGVASSMERSGMNLERIARLWRIRSCAHRFALEDLKLTRIPEPKQPKQPATQEQWRQYFAEYHDGTWHTERVEWACSECGRVFKAHCGLDISPRHGPTFRRETWTMTATTDGWSIFSVMRCNHDRGMERFGT